MNIVLHEPEIPFNTGAIGRTCVATNTPLHLIRPYGFVLNDKYIKRAGMDYWEKLKLSEYLDYEDFLEKHPEIRFADDFCSEKGNASGGRISCEEDNASCEYSSWSREVIETPKLWFATTKGRTVYSDAKIGPNDYIMFGKESAGIPEEILVKNPKACIRIPMWGEIRSLNLSNSAAILLYEAYRQNDFMDLNREGELHRLHW
ncbi:MAG: tRNA (cytidine(34)-2'-O)-methyltransferase [Oribacterium sp.]|nr:tRNA (cytidine(34)-2'-O)-methyltransferase [Oribacterium sp.]